MKNICDDIVYILFKFLKDKSAYAIKSKMKK